MAKKGKTPSRTGFIASIVVLVLGMSVGFFLLSMVYTGSNWVKFVVFIVYLSIVFFLIKFSIVFAKSLAGKGNIDREKRNKV